MVSDVTLQTAIDQQSKTTLASSGLAQDFSQFLQLLTVQLQNQDPLSPMDTTEFTNQIVAFTGVEQQINTNQKLDSLVALQLSGSMASAQSYVGKDISYVSSEFGFDGDPSEIRYSLPVTAQEATLRILNESGQVVYEEDVNGNVGAHEFVWDGRLTGGGIAQDGTYEVVIDALDPSEKAIQATTVVKGTVRGVESQNGQVLLLVGERAVALGNVLNTSTNSANDASSSISAALDYIGLDVSYQNNEILLNSSKKATVSYTLPQDAERAKILIYNDQGQVVFTDDVDTSEGAHDYTWNGDDYSAGEYYFEIEALAQESSLVKRSTQSYDGQTALSTNYTLIERADKIQVNIYNSIGNLVHSESADRDAGTNTFTWDPAGSVPAGDYRVEITAIDDNTKKLSVSSRSSGRVTGIESDNGVIFLQIGPTKVVPLSQIESVSVPEETGGA